MEKIILLLAMILLACCPAWSQDDGEELTEIDIGYPDEPQGTVIDGLAYFFSSAEGAANLRCDNCWEGELAIPAEVEYNGVTYPVTAMSWSSFRDCQTLTKVTIPRTIVSFFRLGSWEDYTPHWVPFVGCTALESIEVDADNPRFSSADGVMFTKDKADLVCYPAGSRRKTYTVQNGVKRIFEDAFANNPYLVSVTFPNTVNNIYPCFRDCNALESVNLPKGQEMKHLLPYLFSGCTSLKKIEIPTSVTTVHDFVFENCSSLTTVELPYSVTQLGHHVFLGCASLKSLVIRGYMEEAADRTVDQQRFGTIPEQVTIYCQPEQVETIQKYFKGTVLPLDEYQPEADAPTAIESAIKDAPANIPTYDLQGRRIGASLNDKGQMINERMKKGVYIRDGRKIVVK
jgi:hypothetical protein